METFRILGFLGLLVSAPLRADVIFDNMVGNTLWGQGILGEGLDTGPHSVAAPFIPDAEYRMNNVHVEVFHVFVDVPTNGMFNMSLYSNRVLLGCGTTGICNVPGGLLRALGTGLVAPDGGGEVVVPTSALLAAGTEYWLVLSPYDQTSSVAWEFGERENPLGWAVTINEPNAWTIPGSDTWVALGATPVSNLQLKITGSPATVPEPVSAVLFASALTATALFSLRRKVAKDARSAPK